MEKDSNEEPPNSELILTCPECSSKFSDSTALTRHIQSTHKRFTCEVCRKSTFPSLILMLRHRSLEHSAAKKTSDVNNHSKAVPVSASSSKKMKCGVCQATKNTKAELRLHYQEAHGSLVDKFYQCGQCNSVFVSKDSVKVHRKKEHGVLDKDSILNSGSSSTQFVCTFCSFKSQSKKSLKLHLTNLHKGKRVKCFECDTYFTDNSGLKGRKLCGICRHGTQYRCKETGCDREFYTEAALRSHISAVHLIHENLCQLCERVFRNEEMLNQHANSVHNGMRAVCSACNTFFKTHDCFKEHDCRNPKFDNESVETSKLSAPNQKPEDLLKSKFTCYNCCKSFDTQILLREHADNCLLDNEAKDFENKIQLKKPYSEKTENCDDITSAHQSNYESEILIPSKPTEEFFSRGQTGFRCPSCTKVCKYLFQLKQHFSAAHEGKLVFPCPMPQCSKKLLTIAHVHAHMRQVHQKKNVTIYKMPCIEQKKIKSKRVDQDIADSQPVKKVSKNRKNAVSEKKWEKNWLTLQRQQLEKLSGDESSKGYSSAEEREKNCRKKLDKLRRKIHKSVRKTNAFEPPVNDLSSQKSNETICQDLTSASLSNSDGIEFAIPSAKSKNVSRRWMQSWLYRQQQLLLENDVVPDDFACTMESIFAPNQSESSKVGQEKSLKRLDLHSEALAHSKASIKEKGKNSKKWEQSWMRKQQQLYAKISQTNKDSADLYEDSDWNKSDENIDSMSNVTELPESVSSLATDGISHGNDALSIDTGICLSDSGSEIPNFELLTSRTLSPLLAMQPPANEENEPSKELENASESPNRLRDVEDEILQDSSNFKLAILNSHQDLESKVSSSSNNNCNNDETQFMGNETYSKIMAAMPNTKTILASMGIIDFENDIDLLELINGSVDEANTSLGHTDDNHLDFSKNFLVDTKLDIYGDVPSPSKSSYSDTATCYYPPRTNNDDTEKSIDMKPCLTELSRAEEMNDIEHAEDDVFETNDNLTKTIGVNTERTNVSSSEHSDETSPKEKSKYEPIVIHVDSTGARNITLGSLDALSKPLWLPLPGESTFSNSRTLIYSTLEESNDTPVTPKPEMAYSPQSSTASHDLASHSDTAIRFSSESSKKLNRRVHKAPMRHKLASSSSNPVPTAKGVFLLESNSRSVSPSLSGANEDKKSFSPEISEKKCSLDTTDNSASVSLTALCSTSKLPESTRDNSNLVSSDSTLFDPFDVGFPADNLGTEELMAISTLMQLGASKHKSVVPTDDEFSNNTVGNDSMENCRPYYNETSMKPSSPKVTKLGKKIKSKVKKKPDAPTYQRHLRSCKESLRSPRRKSSLTSPSDSVMRKAKVELVPLPPQIDAKGKCRIRVESDQVVIMNKDGKSDDDNLKSEDEIVLIPITKGREGSSQKFSCSTPHRLSSSSSEVLPLRCRSRSTSSSRFPGKMTDDSPTKIDDNVDKVGSKSKSLPSSDSGRFPNFISSKSKSASDPSSKSSGKPTGMVVPVQLAEGHRSFENVYQIKRKSNSKVEAFDLTVNNEISKDRSENSK